MAITLGSTAIYSAIHKRREANKNPVRKDRRIVPADCTEPKKFPKDKLGSFVAELNRRRRLMVDGNQQNGGTGVKLKKGRSVMEVEWSCHLEEEAIAALNTTACDMECPRDGPSEIPNGTTGFFDCQYDGKGYEPMGSWLSEMDKNDIYQDPNPEVRVMYGGKNRNYCNLVRYDAYGIGCAEKECSKTRLTFCLTNQP
ncbi:hypothetical protein ANCCAN_09061 [Ancylostoma caninum]|uniref:SCP domain-containing protein n=1 Tax=Ancylostoma caninum TaxID=29170 RepID=A0A368GPW8_ANCCA|nr:hypothetical protein ANCCAN_09061 [Ancylostoma caninum]